MLSTIKSIYLFSLINNRENNMNYTLVMFSEEVVTNFDSISTIIKEYSEQYTLQDWNKLTSNTKLIELFRYLYKLYIKNSYNELNVSIELTNKSYKLLDVNIL